MPLYTVSIREKEAFTVPQHIEDTSHALYELHAETPAQFHAQCFKASRIFQALTRPCALCIKQPGEEAKILCFHDGFYY